VSVVALACDIKGNWKKMNDAHVLSVEPGKFNSKAEKKLGNDGLLLWLTTANLLLPTFVSIIYVDT
jgi:hypothetical protein